MNTDNENNVDTKKSLSDFMFMLFVMTISWK